jgi:transposase
MAELTSTQFDLLARLLQSKEPARSGARLVLVEGKSNPEAYTMAGISPQSLSNTLGRYRKAHADICQAYKVD